MVSLREDRGLTHLHKEYLQVRITLMRTIKNSGHFQGSFSNGCLLRQVALSLLECLNQNDHPDRIHEWRKDHVLKS